jgi:hypothetical protein
LVDTLALFVEYTLEDRAFILFNLDDFGLDVNDLPQSVKRVGT